MRLYLCYLIVEMVLLSLFDNYVVDEIKRKFSEAFLLVKETTIVSLNKNKKRNGKQNFLEQVDEKSLL